MSIRRGLAWVWVIGLATGTPGYGATRYVNVSNAAPSAPYTNWSMAATNIQAAINAAASGDEILVGPGVYRTTTAVFIPGSKRLTLRSTESRAAIMDAQNLSLVLSVSGPGSVVEGFTIRNGLNNDYAGGIELRSSGTVRDCLVINNQAYGGAGIFIEANTSRVEYCTIKQNRAADLGGGVLFYNNATGVVNFCVIADNIASNSGGGVYFQGAGTVSNSWLINNRATAISASYGGGVFMRGGRLVDSVVVSNRAELYGGGVLARYGSYLAHNTIVDNQCNGQGGGMWLADGCTSWNSIVYYNTAVQSNDISAVACVFSNNCSATGLGGSNLTNAPLFANRAAANFRLVEGSPCIDAGATNPAVNIDADGMPRPQPGQVGLPGKYDIGAFEYQPPTPEVYRKLNCGGAAVSGWEADAGWSGSADIGAGSSAAAIANAGIVPAAVYQTRRYGSNLTYTVAVPDGTYNVRLHFAELFWTAANKRVFDLWLEGVNMLPGLDIWTLAGGKDRALTVTIGGVAVSGGLQIQGVGKTGVAQFNGIEVWSAGPPTPRVVAAPLAVTVVEGGGTPFGVKLSAAPAGTVTVTVARVSGDADISVLAGAARIFNAANWASEQTVTLFAQQDADSANGTASIQCSAPGHISATVTATEQDDETPAVDLKINSGGGATGAWVADTNWTVAAGGGAASSAAAIANIGTVPAAVYQTRRYGSTVTYNLAVPNGTYDIRLHFAELAYAAAGQRRFHVSLEGGQVLTNFDIVAAAGGKDRAVVRVFSNVVVSGGLQIQGVGTTGTAQFNGLEVVAAGPPPPAVVATPAAVTVPEAGTATFGVKLNTAPAGTITVTVVRASGDTDITVSAGATRVFNAANYATEQTVTLAAQADADSANGTASIQCAALGYASVAVTATEQDDDLPAVDLKINSGGKASGAWVADTNWTVSAGGGAATNTAAIANIGSVPAAVYQTRRYGSNVTYNLAVPNGTYDIRLYFAELAYTAVGQRRFHVSLEGGLVLTNFDIVAAAGGKDRAVVRTFSNVAVNGGLQIVGVGTTGTAQFNGVEVVSAGSGARRRAPVRAVHATAVMWPVAAARSGAGEWTAAPTLVDGDPDTVWTGTAEAGAWTAAVDFEDCLPLLGVDIRFAGPPRAAGILGTSDRMAWYDLGLVTNWPVPCRALYFQFPDDGTGAPPVIREILWEEGAP